MFKKTKIVATLGPASDSKKTIVELVKAGVNVFRFNTKHSDPAWHAERIDRVRAVSKQLNEPVSILIDLKGPEIRVGSFKDGGLDLEDGETILLVSKFRKNIKEKQLVLEELTVVNNLNRGDKIFLDDGFLELVIEKIETDRQGKKIKTKVIEGGWLKNNKSVNFPGAKVDLPSLIKQDLDFLSMSAKKDVDYVAYSFVRNRKDIDNLRQILAKQGLEARVISKIESQEAIDNFEEILEASDGIMVARGDLGVEVPLEKVPFYQKMMVQRCREEAKPVIVATQMLESMVDKPRPTRAEVSDVANAVYDATDAIMLSAETASGKFPVKTVETMARIAHFVESKYSCQSVKYQGRNLTEVVTYSANKMLESEFLENMQIKAFVLVTDTGATARFLARLRPQIPIVAVTNHKITRDQLCLSYGVRAFYRHFSVDPNRSTISTLEFLRQERMFKKGDRVIMVYGKKWGGAGTTNTIRIEEIQ